MAELGGSWCTEAEYESFKKQLIRLEDGKPKCFYCKNRIDLRLSSRSSESFTIDHLKPQSRYPELSKTVSNMVMAHKSCNSSKGVQTVEKTLADIAVRARGTRPEWHPGNN